MRFLRCAILAIGLLGLAASTSACGGKDKGAVEPSNPCAEGANPCAEGANPCAEGANPCAEGANPCAENPCAGADAEGGADAPE